MVTGESPPFGSWIFQLYYARERAIIIYAPVTNVTNEKYVLGNIEEILRVSKFWTIRVVHFYSFF